MMIRILLAAIAAGLVAGIMMSPLQYTKVVPIIQLAERYEGGQGHEHGTADKKASRGHVEDDTVGAGHHHDEASGADSEAKADGEALWFGRFWNTLLANLVTGAGFGLLMAGVSLACGVNVTFATGLTWGALGWLCVQLLPALGLPPELPGFPTADHSARQIWWVATVCFSILGFWLLLLSRPNTVKALGVVLLIAPHAYGAVQPDDITSTVPAYLASQYAAASLATTLFFWLVLGIALGFLMDRMKLERS